MSKGRYRVWQWGIEIGLGSHCQSKMSSRIIKHGFDSKTEALAWAAKQDQSDWGNWLAVECGQSVVVECNWECLPTSYSEAVSAFAT
jgi:hypothetical protein